MLFKYFINLSFFCDDFKYIPKNNFFKFIFFKLYFYFNVNKYINLVFLNKRDMFFINKKFRYKNSITDIISFPYSYNIKKINLNLLGDIILCPLEIYERSNIRSIGYLVYFTRLLIHGFLHLLNFHHYNYLDYKFMSIIEEKIFCKIWKKKLFYY